jgi:hypothetical protein
VIRMAITPSLKAAKRSFGIAGAPPYLRRCRRASVAGRRHDSKSNR